MTFSEMLQASYKSEDTEEWLDIYFTRPVGLMFALLWIKLGVKPNTVTILSIFLGTGAGYMFSFIDLTHNLVGVLLLVLANLCDSTDGQMARLTGNKTLTGRILDGFSGDVWFFSIYFAICMRLMPQHIPGTDMEWGWWIWGLGAVAGLVCHSPQSSLADYYRQIHLWFLKGKSGSELDSYAAQRKIYESLPKEQSTFWKRAFHFNYANYCKSQENRTPIFQQLRNKMSLYLQHHHELPTSLKERFLMGSRPLMKYTNILTFNVRAICIYITCLADMPWLYLLFEITVMSVIYIYMHNKHEKLCKQLLKEELWQKD